MADKTKTSMILDTSDVSAGSLALAPSVAHARELVGQARAANTLRAYAGSFKRFEGWCTVKKVSPESATPAEVALFLADRHAGAFPPGSEPLSPVSLDREYNGVAFFLRQKAPDVWTRARPPHVISELLAGAHRVSGRPPDRKRPLLAKHFVALARLPVDRLGDGLIGVRNRALLLLGFAGAFRRSELVALRREDVSLEPAPAGLRIVLRRSKQDQEGRGYVKGVLRADAGDVCPVRAVAAWVSKGGIVDGPLFRRILPAAGITADPLRDANVADVVKRACVLLGLPPSKYAGHSLRSGFVTSVALQGGSLDEIMVQTGHRSVEQVREYIRRENVFQNNPTRGLFK
jgi:integrase